ncbi:hypothetical protein SAMN05444920_106350 [Nonomuraea solani]|uniref:Uncharacterized protein n=1 Tax=Nonomuraea solani TaxID=1144553 RepID=A0A1H6DW77_9ACTN|nr:hypothetical protein [Nonomuraea solani]SEG88976.1 hypothetical protein SAMN05444920_106350 [Nonomuraea solani]
MIRKLGRLLTTLVAAALIVGLTSLLPPRADAEVASKPAASGSLADHCSPYTNAQFWHTSVRWGRVRERVCVEENSRRQVRAVAQFAVDWPRRCTLSAGLPPQVSGTCDSNAYRFRSLSIKSLRIVFGYTAPNGVRRNGLVCKFESRWNVVNVDGRSDTKRCWSSWRPKLRGTYRVRIDYIEADVFDDGQGYKKLAPISDTFVLT